MICDPENKKIPNNRILLVIIEFGNVTHTELLFFPYISVVDLRVKIESGICQGSKMFTEPS